MTKRGVLDAVVLGAGVLIGSASAAPVTWTDWLTISGTSASGSIGAAAVTVTATSGSMNGPSQTSCGTNFWTQPLPSSPAYTAGTVSNAPTACEQVGLSSPVSITVDFSAPVTNLYMALLSVGQSGVPITYDFNTAFSVDSEGRGFWGDGSFTLGAGDTIVGRELHGVLLFAGTLSSISFTTSPTEFWHAFTFGVGGTTVKVPESGTLALLGLGVVGLVLTRRRKQ